MKSKKNPFSGKNAKPANVFRKKELAIAVSAACSLLTTGITKPAFAQDDLEEVTITGSRITKRDLSAPSPILTVGSEDFENTSTAAVESVINKLPQFAPGDTQFLAGAADIQSSASNTPGASTLNLRGMGANRNLVLGLTRFRGQLVF